MAFIKNKCFCHFVLLPSQMSPGLSEIKKKLKVGKAELLWGHFVHPKKKKLNKIQRQIMQHATAGLLAATDRGPDFHRNSSDFPFNAHIYIYIHIYICSMYGIFTYIWLKFVYNYVQQGGGFQPFFMFTSTCGKFPFWQIKNWTGWNHNMYMSFYISESFSWHHGAESYVVRERKLIRQKPHSYPKICGGFPGWWHSNNFIMQC